MREGCPGPTVNPVIICKIKFTHFNLNTLNWKAGANTAEVKGTEVTQRCLTLLTTDTAAASSLRLVPAPLALSLSLSRRDLSRRNRKMWIFFYSKVRAYATYVTNRSAVCYKNIENKNWRCPSERLNV